MEMLLVEVKLFLNSRGFSGKKARNCLVGFYFLALLFYEANVMVRFFLFAALRDSLSSLSQHSPNLPAPYLCVTDSLGGLFRVTWS